MKRPILKLSISFVITILIVSCSLEKKPQVKQPIGEDIYTERCVICHGVDGSLGINGAKNLQDSKLPYDQVVAQVTNGKGAMASFKNILTAQEIDSVSNYIFTLRK